MAVVRLLIKVSKTCRHIRYVGTQITITTAQNKMERKLCSMFTSLADLLQSGLQPIKNTTCVVPDIPLTIVHKRKRPWTQSKYMKLCTMPPNDLRVLHVLGYSLKIEVKKCKKEDCICMYVCIR